MRHALIRGGGKMQHVAKPLPSVLKVFVDDGDDDTAGRVCWVMDYGLLLSSRAGGEASWADGSWGLDRLSLVTYLYTRHKIYRYYHSNRVISCSHALLV